MPEAQVRRGRLVPVPVGFLAATVGASRLLPEAAIHTGRRWLHLRPTMPAMAPPTMPCRGRLESCSCGMVGIAVSLRSQAGNARPLPFDLVALQLAVESMCPEHLADLTRADRRDLVGGSKGKHRRLDLLGALGTHVMVGKGASPR